MRLNKRVDIEKENMTNQTFKVVRGMSFAEEKRIWRKPMANKFFCQKCGALVKISHELVELSEISCLCCNHIYNNKDDSNRRAELRLKREMNTIIYLNGNVFVTKVINLSATGACISTSEDIPISLSEKIAMKIPPLDLVTSAKVVWLKNSSPGSNLVGLEINKSHFKGNN